MNTHKIYIYGDIAKYQYFLFLWGTCMLRMIKFYFSICLGVSVALVVSWFFKTYCLHHAKTCFGHMWAAKAQISLHIYPNQNQWTLQNVSVERQCRDESLGIHEMI